MYWIGQDSQHCGRSKQLSRRLSGKSGGAYGAIETSQETLETFILQDDRHSVENTSVHFGSIFLGLELSLQL